MAATPYGIDPKLARVCGPAAATRVLPMFLLALAATLAIPFDAATRAALPPAEATLTAHGAAHACSGVWLRDLVARAGVASGDAVKGPALATVITAEAADGYRIVFSLGELDARLGNAAVLVADHCDGKPLSDADGPVRLVAAGEVRAARSVRQLTKLTATTLP
jgi:hypothetical protein